MNVSYLKQHQEFYVKATFGLGQLTFNAGTTHVYVHAWFGRSMFKILKYSRGVCILQSGSFKSAKV